MTPEEVKELQKDGERLDWLEKQEAPSIISQRGPLAHWQLNVGKVSAHGSTLRNAIDTAMVFLGKYEGRLQ